MCCCSAAMATRELLSSSCLESVWREQRQETGGLFPGLFWEVLFHALCCVFTSRWGGGAGRIWRGARPPAAAIYTPPARAHIQGCLRVHGPVWIQEVTSQTAERLPSSGLGWVLSVWACMCVNRGPACSLTAPLHPWRADTHTQLHWHTVCVTWFRSKDRRASCSGGKPGGETQLSDFSRMNSRGVWRRWHRLAVSLSLCTGW